MLLNKAGKDVNEKNIETVLKAADVKIDLTKIKSLVSALQGVNVEEVIASANLTQAAPAQNTSNQTQKETPKKEEKEKTPTVDAAAGLGSLF